VASGPISPPLGLWRAQYASYAYTELLEKSEIAISMSRTGNPYDNARAERFMRTLKYEEVYAPN
jgi:transposase InsO family protein